MLLENIVVDLSSPNASLTVPNATITGGSTRNISGVIVLNASVNDSHGVNTVHFNLSNSTAGNVTSLIAAGGNGTNPGETFNATFTSTNFLDGRFNISVRAVDFAGNRNDTDAEGFV